MEHVQEKQPPDVIASDTDNRTTIFPKEAPPDKQHQFERFKAYNTGLWNGPRRENTELMNRQDDLHLFDSIAGQVDLTPYQKKRGRHLLDQFSIGEYTAPGRDAASVVFGLCVLIANEDVEAGTRYWPHPEAASNDVAFERVADSLTAHWTDLVSIIMRMGNRLEV